MAKVQSSPETIRQFKLELNKTVKELQDTAGKINSALNSSSGWSDAQGEQFRDLMKRISRLIVSPIEALNGAQPKLEKLAQSLDSYNRVRF